jgi:hypothetical protein
MTRIRWTALAVTTLALAAAILYPPFGFTNGNGYESSLGMHLLFDPPGVSISDQEYARTHVHVRYDLLAWECAGIFAIGGLAFALGRRRGV